jgi:hypothetical protein
MKQEIYDRRREMLSFHQQGLKLVDWAPLVATKYKSTEDAIKRDWGRRRVWVHHFLRLDDPLDMAKKLVSDNEVLMLDADNLFEKADDPKIRLQIMWLRLKIFSERINLMKEMGGFEPIKADFEVKMRVHREKLCVERNPQLKGDEDHRIREAALRKCVRELPYFG